MNPSGYAALVLHAHLPFVRHPEHSKFHEEKWLFEAITECYVPILTVLDGLVTDDVEFRLTVGLTPTLVEMLGDELLRERYRRHLDDLIDLAENESKRLSRHAELGSVAALYADRFRRVRENFFERLGGDLVRAFRRLQELGRVEILTSAATHGFLPSLRTIPSAVRAQVAVGVDSYKRAFGEAPQGFWLPECAFYPGLDQFLADEGIRYFLLERHGILRGDRRVSHGSYEPIVCPSGVAAFGRDGETSQLVWSSEVGYPGDAAYRDFYKDLGYDGALDTVRGVLGPDGARAPTGLKYYRITGPMATKQPYDRERALERVDVHAADFVERVARRIEAVAPSMSTRPIVVAPYDAELFGHWWFEGPEWLDRVLRKFAARADAVTTVTASEYLAEYPRGQMSTPSESSWGEGGYHEVWINPTNDHALPEIQRASRRFAAIADRFPDADGDLRRALDQAARELLLMQSSDWLFLQRSQTAPEYSRRRLESHLDRFEFLLTVVEEISASGDVSESTRDQLAQIETRDTIFPWIDYRVFAENLPSDAETLVNASRPAVARVAFITAEAAPYAKAGGLGDVAGALPEALARLGVEVTVVLPAYRVIDRQAFSVRVLRENLSVSLEGQEEVFRVLEVSSTAPGVRVLLVDHPYYFDRDGIYDDPRTKSEYPDTARRFVFFSKAALASLSALGEPIDVLHCHDHQTALALALRRLHYTADQVLADAAGVFTIHNLGYQGVYDPSLLGLAGVDMSFFYPGSPFEFYGGVNLMKIGITLADKVNAVSQRYVDEICGDSKLSGRLDGVLRERGDDLVGILNGIDVDAWDPARDPSLPEPYSADDLRGKRAAKARLLETFGLETAHLEDVPVVGMVTRLVDQKGLDLVEAGFEQMMALGVDFIALGTGQAKHHAMLERAATRYPGRVGVALRFDNALAHLIEAGADMFLMPSAYEPCGLNQMYSLRYGTIPVVRRTGGLADTVQDDDATDGHGVGFSFDEYSSMAMLEALERAVKAYRSPARWRRLMDVGMRRDHSWKASAKRYLRLYEAAVGRRREGVTRSLEVEYGELTV